MSVARTMSCAGCGETIPVVTCSVRCGPCRKAKQAEQNKAQYQKDRAKVAARHQVRYADNPDRFRGYHYKHRYGVTRADVDQMHQAQGGACAICAKPVPITGAERTKLAAVDHCHTTKKVRGLLCRPCNLLLGNASDSTDVLRAAIAYLERSA